MNLECGVPPKVIADLTGFSRKYIERLRRNLWIWGLITKPKLSKLGASRLLTEAMTKVGLFLEMGVCFTNN